MSGGGLSTHVLDLAKGRPARGVSVVVELREADAWRALGRAETDGDGRAAGLLGDGVPPAAGTYRLRFDTGAYFAREGVAAFFPEVTVVFTVREAGGGTHVPLLLSPFGYSTYRGS